MTAFQINLIRQRVQSPAKRRKIYAAMLCYLVITGLCTVWVSHYAVRRCMRSSGMRDRISAMETTFRNEHPGQEDIVLYGRSLEKQLESLRQKIEAVNSVCEQKTELGRILLAISAPLPSNVNLASLELRRDHGAMEFELDFPVDRAGQTTDASQLLAGWNTHPDVAPQLKKIASVRTQKRTVDGRLVERWKFASPLAAAEGEK